MLAIPNTAVLYGCMLNQFGKRGKRALWTGLYINTDKTLAGKYEVSFNNVHNFGIDPPDDKTYPGMDKVFWNKDLGPAEQARNIYLHNQYYVAAVPVFRNSPDFDCLCYTRGKQN